MNIEVIFKWANLPYPGQYILCHSGRPEYIQNGQQILCKPHQLWALAKSRKREGPTQSLLFSLFSLFKGTFVRVKNSASTGTLEDKGSRRKRYWADSGAFQKISPKISNTIDVTKKVETPGAALVHLHAEALKCSWLQMKQNQQGEILTPVCSLMVLEKSPMRRLIQTTPIMSLSCQWKKGDT